MRTVSWLAVALVAVGVLVTPLSGRSEASPATKQGVARRIPRLVDVGSGSCIPCKAMAPILEELKTEYAGRMDVQFIDARKNPDVAKPYGVHVIPTQIFYGADGRELARHQGFMAKQDILAQWKALGVKL
jgi:thioredoxin 1